MGTIYNRGKYTRRRRELRNSAPTAERILWERLKRRQLLGLKFRRQFGVGSFVVDFYCPEVKFAVEIDGPSHDTPAAKRRDAARQQWIEGFGIVFLRIRNEEIYDNIEKALQRIEEEARRLLKICAERSVMGKV